MLLVFFLPFDRIPSIEIAGASIRLSLIIGGLVILRAAYLIITKKTKFKFITADKIILAFLAWIVLIIPESINLSRALSVVVFNAFAVLLAISVSVIFNKKYIKDLIYALFISCGITVVFAVYQYLGDLFGLSIKYTGLLERYTYSVFGFPRVQAFSLEPLYYSSYLLIPYSFALALLFIKQKIIPTKFAYFVLAISSFTIFMTVSRGGIYGLIGAIALALIFSFIKKTEDFKRHALASLVIVTAGFLLSLLVINYLNKPINAKKTGANAFIDQVKKTGLSEGDERSVARNNALRILSENKSAYLIGIGPGQYGPYQQNNARGEGWTIVNNLPLELLLETGLIGLILVIIFFANIFFKGAGILNSTKDPAVAVVAMAICTYLISQGIQYQSFSTLYVIHIWVVTGLLIGVIRNNSKN
jgi:O-antigen ligase